MYVRVKSTPNSPRRSVQIVQSSRDGTRVRQTIVRHVGIAMDAQEEDKLRRLGQETIAALLAEQIKQAPQSDLFNSSAEDLLACMDAKQAHLSEQLSSLQESGAHNPDTPHTPDAEPQAGAAAPDPYDLEHIHLKDVMEASRVIEGPHDVLGHLYDYLGYGNILPGTRQNDLLRNLVLARIMAPASKLATSGAMQKKWGKQHSPDAIYRLMDRVHEHIPKIKQAVYRSTVSLTGGRVDVVLFDVTTLYFESTDADELRKFGYSKDQKYHCTQVVLALATNEDGLPIGYELFAGNTAEVHTLSTALERWRESLQINRLTLVADRAMCSQSNRHAMEQMGIDYVVAMPLRRQLKAHEQAMVLNPAVYHLQAIGDHFMWVGEFEFQGKRLICTYSASRARKDQHDRQGIIDKLTQKLNDTPSDLMNATISALDATGTEHDQEAKQANKQETNDQPKKRQGRTRKLVTNQGYLKYTTELGGCQHVTLDLEKIDRDARWDGMHAVLTTDREASAEEILTRYRRLWVIEESFRIQKHNLSARPIYHHKSERIQAHIALCFLSFSLLRQALQRIKLAQTAITPIELVETLASVQASIYVHRRVEVYYRMPGSMPHAATKIYRAFGLKRNMEPERIKSGHYKPK